MDCTTLPTRNPHPHPMSPPLPSSPGPVLVDIPKDIQQTLAVPDWDQPMDITSYISRLPPPPPQAQLQRVIEAMKEVRGWVGCCFEGRNATFCAFWWGPRRSCSAWWRIKEVGGWDTFCEGWGACALRAGLPLPLPFPSFQET